MEDKRVDLTVEKQKVLITQLVQRLSRAYPDLYYQSTSDVAHILRQHIDTDKALSQDDRELLKPLSPYDIQILLSLN